MRISGRSDAGRLAERGGDFIAIVKANPDLDLRLLQRLGELVYSGGGKDVLKRVDDAKAGRVIQL
jgi:hypothetical protein